MCTYHGVASKTIVVIHISAGVIAVSISNGIGNIRKPKISINTSTHANLYNAGYSSYSKLEMYSVYSTEYDKSLKHELESV